jgi:ubiquinone/menaquinone biosynthesis C-methylase UbiE
VSDAGLVFDSAAEAYDRARLGYPPEIVDAACVRAGLGPGSRVVEVGGGWGKLPVAVAARALEVDAVDPGANLIAIARSRVGDAAVRFHHGRFEDVRLPEDAYEAVFSATAFHWVDPAVGWRKAAALLRPGGTLALLAHVGGWATELQEDLLAAWREVLPEASAWQARSDEELWAGAQERLDDVSELWSWFAKRELAHPNATRMFGDASLERVEIELEETVEQALAHVRTQSGYLRLDAQRRRRIEERLRDVLGREGDVIRSRLSAVLVTARRAD